MPYPKNIFDKALEIKREQKQKALNEQALAESEIYSSFPDIKEIDLKLKKTYYDLIKCALTKNNDEIDKINNERILLKNKLSLLYKEHNISEDKLSTKYTCSLCEDEGYKNGKMCSCLKDIMMNLSAKGLCGLDFNKIPDFSLFDTSLYKDKESLDDAIKKRDICINFAKNFKSEESDSIFMTGKTGLGKTFLSMCIAKELIKSGFSVIYDSAQGLLSKIESYHFSYEKDEQDPMEMLLFADLLIIDDLGTEFNTQFTSSAIYEIINKRSFSHKSTIISTNLTIEQIEKRYSNRVLSRIVGQYILLKFSGNDLRCG